MSSLFGAWMIKTIDQYIPRKMVGESACVPVAYSLLLEQSLLHLVLI